MDIVPGVSFPAVIARVPKVLGLLLAFRGGILAFSGMGRNCEAMELKRIQ
jgi:hypothetical protein